jgi:hypothetical protein
VRFQVHTAANMMFRVVFWDILPGKMIVDRRFRGAYCYHHQFVTYSGSLFTMELYCTPKSQYTTVKHSQQLFEHT